MADVYIMYLEQGGNETISFTIDVCIRLTNQTLLCLLNSKKYMDYQEEKEREKYVKVYK